MSRPPSSEYSRGLIEARLYPLQEQIEIEGIGLDIEIERRKLYESNTQWLSRESRALHREFMRLQK